MAHPIRTLKRALTNWRAFSACSALRDESMTCAPPLARSPATRWPTGPVPPSTSAFLPFTLPSACSVFTTAATAVVFDPFESSMIDTLNGGNIESTARASSCSPAAMLVPPIQTAVLWRSFGPRVNRQP